MSEQTTGTRPPHGWMRDVAMLRGSQRLGWALYDADGRTITYLPYCGGDGRIARRRAATWCAEHGFHLSALSDADDRAKGVPPVSDEPKEKRAVSAGSDGEDRPDE